MQITHGETIATLRRDDRVEFVNLKQELELLVICPKQELGNAK